MNKPGPEERLIELVVQTRLDTADPDAVAELQQLLQDPALCRLYIELISLQNQLETAHTQGGSDQATEQAAFSDAVTSLRAEQELPPIHLGSSDALGKRQVIAALTYVIEHTFTPRRIAMIASAAAVLLGVVLAIVLMSRGPDTNEQIVEQPVQEPVSPVVSPLTKTRVATLTAEHNAQWAQGAFARGSSLQAGQRLTLTVGFAEITTNRGAIATLEAPCTIEMIDHDNGLELIQGKLVGHCPTRQSQGFLVRTPSTQVIDLGTEFGVDVDAAGETDVYVFTGLVALADPQDDPRVAELTEVAAGQGKRVDRQGRTSRLTNADAADRFVRSIDASALYERLVLADKPLIYYRMDNVIGGIERNLASDRYHAKVFGNVSAITEAGRSSFSLNTSGDYLQTTEPIAELRGAESYTMECWVRATRYDFGVICEIMQTDVDQSLASPAGARLETLGKAGISSLGGSNKLRFVQYENFGDEPSADNLNRTNAFSGSKYPLDRWMHLAAVKSGQTMTLYLDGEPVGQANEPKNIVDVDLSIRIGKFFGTKDSPSVHIRQFLGQLDELAIYGHALSSDAIRARVDAGRDWTSP